jgi:hypothetical protein
MNQKNKFKDNQGIVDLSSLIETTTMLTSSLDFKFILNHIMLASMGKLLVSKSFSAVRLASGGTVSIDKGLHIPSDIIDGLLIQDIDRPIIVHAHLKPHTSKNSVITW